MRKTRAPTERPSFSDRLLLRIAVVKHLDGLWVGADNTTDLNRTIEALGLIKRYEPRRYTRLLRDLDRVWVRLIPEALARFNPSLRACELDTRYVRDQASTPELIAATIVHEATHARLWHCGIGYEEDQRHRVEAVCVRREQ